MGAKNKQTLPGLSSFVVKKSGKNNYGNFSGGDITDAAGGDTMTFPDFSTMSCQQLEQEINNMTATLAAESLVIKNPVWVSSYEDAINTAKTFYNSKGCAVKSGDGGTKENNLPVDGGSGVVIGNTDNGTPVKSTNPVVMQTAVGTTPSGETVVATSMPSAKKIPWGLILVGAVVGLVLFTSNKSTAA